MAARVLFVDDDPLLLKVLFRSFAGRYDLHVASSGPEALALVRGASPFAVVVADMNMPGMDGVELFQELKALAPDTTRIMLTAQEDQLTAMEALNGGNVFRFLTKPCDPQSLAAAVEAGIRQFDLLMSNRELLEQTLAGSVQVLVDLLSVFDPKAFGQAQRVREYALLVAARLGIPSPWDLGLAALLAPAGRMAMPLAIQTKLTWGEPLLPAEQDACRRIPETCASLVGNIPRLQPVARIIRYSGKDFDGSGFPHDGVKGADLPLESRILRALTDFAEGLRLRRSAAVVLGQLKLTEGVYDPHVLAALEQVLETPAAANAGGCQTRVPLGALKVGMALAEDVCTPDGAMVLAAGTRLAPIHLERLKGVSGITRLTDPVLVEGV
jgi:response regulator RpfG family c-di-GMP phosphodiesterase